MKFIKKIPKLLRIIILLIILLAILLMSLFFVYMRIIGFTFEPTPNMISRIESTGRDATCADLIGNWRVLGKLMTWEFREDGTSVVEGFLGDEYRLEDPYTCDDSTRTATIPFLDTCAPPNTAMLVTTRLGAISEDRMMIYTGNADASDVYVMERK